jgi:hypothetical protein
VQVLAQPIEPIALPRAAPIVGELIGHRLWRIEGGNLLRSYSAGSAWWPGRPMEARTEGGKAVEDHNSVGIWAFKEPYSLTREFFNTWQERVVFGTCWLWGTIVEHERGYRAQYGSVRSLDFSPTVGVNLDVLRETYHAIAMKAIAMKGD